MDYIGKVSATMNNPSSGEDFSFWIKEGILVAPFDMVAVKNQNDSITIGVIEEIYHVTDSMSHISSFVSHDFGNMASDPINTRLGTVYATARVLNNDKDIYMPLLDGQSVRFGTEEEIKEALGMNRINDENKIPAGFLSLSNDVTIPICLDSDFVIGPEGAHLNVSGISGLATKTSYIMFLLQSISQKTKGSSIATIIFNVKGKDLLYIDEPNESPDRTDIANSWEKCELKAEPFPNVKYLMPYFDNPEHGYTNSWCDADTIKRRQSLGIARNYIYTYKEDKDKIDLLLSNVDDPAFTLESIRGELLSNKGDFGQVQDWNTLMDSIERKCGTGQSGTSGITAISWRRFKRHLGNHFKNEHGLFQQTESQKNEKNHVHVSQEIKKIKDGDVIVVDIAPIEEQEKCLVFGDVIRTIYEMKTEGSDDCPDKIVIFVDELNKYAPENQGNSPIIKDLLEITERGRSLGIILFAAEQFRSAVHSRVKGNCGTNVYGRTNAVEIATSDYRYIPKSYANMMTRLDKGNLIISHPTFRNLLKLRFPRPCYKQPAK